MKKYLVKLDRDGAFSMVGFVMWTAQIEYAKQYTLEEAEKLIREIPEHIGVGSLVEVPQ